MMRLTEDGRIIGNTLLREIKSEQQRWKICMMSVLFFGLLAHGMGFVHLTVNQDSLSEFYWSNSVKWKLHLGRYLEPVLRLLLGQIIALPWLGGMLAILLMGYAVVLISRLFFLNKVWENVALSGILVCNPVIITQVATYIHDFPQNMIAMVMAIWAAWAWLQMEEKFSWKYTLFGASCLFVCFGIYQAYLSVMLVLLCLMAMTMLLKGQKAWPVVQHLLRAAPIGILGVIAYALGLYLSVVLLDANLGGGGGNNVLQIGDALRNLDSLIVDGYQMVLMELFGHHWSTVKSLTGPTSLGICVVNGLLALRALLAAIRVIRVRKLHAGEICLLIALTAVLPLCMSCVCIISDVFHYLLRLSVFLFYLLVMILLGLERQLNKKESYRWQQVIAAAMLGVVIFSHIQVSNVSHEKKKLEVYSTLSTMTRVLERLEASEGYELGKTEICFGGVISSHQVDLKVGNADQMMGMSSNSQMPYSGLTERYVQYYLQYPINLCSDEKRNQIMETEQFQSMGSFPAQDSVAYIDGILVVKLGDTDYIFD